MSPREPSALPWGAPVHSDLPNLPRECNPSLPSPAGVGGIPLKPGKAAGVPTALETRYEPAYFAKHYPGLQPSLLYTREKPLTAAGTGAGMAER